MNENILIAIVAIITGITFFAIILLAKKEINKSKQKK